MTHFYGDLLRDYENRFTKGYYGGSPVYLKFKTEPSDKVKLTQTFRLSRSVDTKDDVQTTTWSTANGTTLKTACCHEEVASKLKFGNNALTYEVGYKPSDWNNADKSLTLKHGSTFDTHTSRINSTESVKFGLPKAGPLGLWLTLDLAWNTQDTKRNLKSSANFNFQDYHLGGKVDYDLTAHKVNSLNALALLKNPKGDFFAAADVLTKEVTLGCHHGHSDRSKHAIEVVIDGTQKSKGVCGQPAVLNFAGQYKLTDAATLKTKVSLGKEWTLSHAWIHHFDNRLKLSFSHDFNVTQVLKGSVPKGQSPFDFGAALQWNL